MDRINRKINEALFLRVIGASLLHKQWNNLIYRIASDNENKRYIYKFLRQIAGAGRGDGDGCNFKVFHGGLRSIPSASLCVSF